MSECKVRECKVRECKVSLLVFAERPLAFVRVGTCSTADALEVSMEWTTSHNLHCPVDAAVCTLAAAMGWLQTCWTRSVLLCCSMARLGVGLGNGLWCLGRFRGHLVQSNQQPSVTHSASPRVGGNFTQLLSAYKCSGTYQSICTRTKVV